VLSKSSPRGSGSYLPLEGQAASAKFLILGGSTAIEAVALPADTKSGSFAPLLCSDPLRTVIAERPDAQRGVKADAHWQ
jgi:hypothetical protein